MKFNPLIFSGLDLTGSGGGTSPFWGDAVATESALPATGIDGEARVALDTDKIYVWDDTSSQWIDTGISLASFGGTPNTNGLTIGTNDVGNIRYRTIQLNPADATNPGGVSTGTQTFAGDKTFADDVTVDGNLDVNGVTTADGGLDVTATGGTDTLAIGTTNADIINIGRSGITINMIGDTINQTVTNLNVTDKNITLNSGGGVGSGSAVGIDVEENAIITGYVETSGGRNSWVMKAPNTAGVITFTPGASGFTIDQGSHDPITLAAFGSTPNSNGLTLSSQVLNLEPADATNPGAVSIIAQEFSGLKTFLDQIAIRDTSAAFDISIVPTSSPILTANRTLTVDLSNADRIIDLQANLTVSGIADISGTNTGDITLDVVGSTPNANGATLVGQVLNLEPADATNPGVVTTGTQTIAGIKSFSNQIQANASGSASIPSYSFFGDTNTGMYSESQTLSFTTNGTKRFSIEFAGYVHSTLPISIQDGLEASPAIRFFADDDTGIFTDAANELSISTNGVKRITVKDTGLQILTLINDGPVITDGLGNLSSENYLALARGGTNNSLIATAGALPFSTSTNLSLGPVGTSGQVLTSGGTSVYTWSNFVPASPGDLAETSFSAANNQAVADDITGFAFSNASIRSFKALISASIDATTPLAEEFNIEGIQKAGGWEISVSSIGDDSEILFSITSLGQMQYTSGNYTGFVSATIKFRSWVTTV